MKALIITMFLIFSISSLYAQDSTIILSDEIKSFDFETYFKIGLAHEVAGQMASIDLEYGGKYESIHFATILRFSNKTILFPIEYFDLIKENYLMFGGLLGMETKEEIIFFSGSFGLAILLVDYEDKNSEFGMLDPCLIIKFELGARFDSVSVSIYNDYLSGIRNSFSDIGSCFTYYF